MNTDERIRNAVVAAQGAFWSNLAETYPEIKTGDFSPEAQNAFDTACLSAVQEWVRANAKGCTSIPARLLRPGQWMVFNTPQQNCRIVEVSATRLDDIRVRHDFGDSNSEPATSFFEPDEMVMVAADGNPGHGGTASASR